MGLGAFPPCAVNGWARTAHPIKKIKVTYSRGPVGQAYTPIFPIFYLFFYFLYLPQPHSLPKKNFSKKKFSFFSPNPSIGESPRPECTFRPEGTKRTFLLCPLSESEVDI